MKSNLINTTFKYISIFFSIIFLIQAITGYSIIPLEKAIEFLGIGKGVLQLVIAILYIAIIIIGVGAILSFLNRKKVVKGVTKNTIILTLIVKAFMMFVIFFITGISFWLLGSLGLFGEEIKIAIKDGKTLADLNQVSFLNFYIFWYLLVTTFVKHEIYPEFGVTKDEKKGFV